MSFPKKLNLEQYFSSPVWWADETKFVKKLNKASDKYIKDAQKRLKKDIDKRNKEFGDKGDMGHVFHSTSLIGDPKFKQLQDYIGGTCYNLLDEMGFDLSFSGKRFITLPGLGSSNTGIDVASDAFKK